MRKLFTIIFVIFVVIQMHAQTTLSAGDIAIFGINADNPDDFGFVLLVDVEAGTEIRFTDSGVKSNGSFRGNEGAVKWTASSALSAGTEITYQGNNSDFTSDNDATVGNNGFNLSGSGDQVIAFQGASSSPTFIYAAQINSNQWQSDATASTNSALPPGLTNGTEAVAAGAGSGAGDEYDNAAYNKSTMSGTKSELLSAISDNANWTGDNSNRYDLTTYDFTVNNSTPVELMSFAAIVERNSVTLNWQTATEINNYGFEIQRAAVGTKFTVWNVVGFVEGAGNSNSPKAYSFTDYVNASGKYSYRLKQIDLDGSYKYSQTIEVELNAPVKFELAQNYPNPFNPTTTINYSIAKEQVVTLKVYDMLGREVAELVNAKQAPGNYKVNFNASGLTSGVYFYKLQSGDFVNVKKMTLMK